MRAERRRDTPETWLRVIHTLCQNQGLGEADAQECVTPVLLAYHRLREAYPWEETHPCLALLRQQVSHVVLDCRRRWQRHQERLLAYLSCLPPAVMPSYEDEVVDRVMVEQWVATLPTRLQEVVRLRLEGFTCEEIAQQVGVSLGTVLGYLKEVKKKFLKSYPHHPIVCASHDGI